MATATHTITEDEAASHPHPEAVVVRFAGDSGDGMQLTGGQFTLSTALAGNDLSTFPDFPAEIRAPQGTTFGVSAFQINFGSTSIETAGDQPDVLIAMNPAALKVNVDQLREGGLIIADEGEFSARNLAKAGYEQSPLEDGSLAKWQLVHFNISQLTLDAVKPFGLGNKEALRCKNMWTLGLALWMFDRDRQPIVDWLNAKFAKAPELAEANIAALNAGHAYGETVEIGGVHRHHIAAAPGRAWPLPHRHRRRIAGAGPCRGCAAGRFEDVLRRLPDHACFRAAASSVAAEGIWDHDLPGGGRDCGHLLGHRRELRRSARHHFVVGSRHRAQDRGARASRS